MGKKGIPGQINHLVEGPLLGETWSSQEKGPAKNQGEIGRAWDWGGREDVLQAWQVMSVQWKYLMGDEKALKDPSKVMHVVLPLDMCILVTLR